MKPSSIPGKSLRNWRSDRHGFGKAEAGELQVVSEGIIEIQRSLAGWPELQGTFRRYSVRLDSLPPQQLSRRDVECDVRMADRDRRLARLLQEHIHPGVATKEDGNMMRAFAVARRRRATVAPECLIVHRHEIVGAEN